MPSRLVHWFATSRRVPALSSFALQHSHYIPKPHCDTLWLLFMTPQTPTPYISCHKTHQAAGSKMVHSGRGRSRAKLCDTLLWLMRAKMWLGFFLSADAHLQAHCCGPFVNLNVNVFAIVPASRMPSSPSVANKSNCDLE